MKIKMLAGMMKFLRKQKEERETFPPEIFHRESEKEKRRKRKGPDNHEARDLKSEKYCVRMAMRGGYALDLTTKEILAKGESLIHKNTKSGKGINKRVQDAIRQLENKFGYKENLTRKPAHLRKLEAAVAEAGRGHL